MNERTYCHEFSDTKSAIAQKIPFEEYRALDVWRFRRVCL